MPTPSTQQEALASAQRVVHTLPWGEVVWHVWGAQAGLAPLVLLHGGSGSWTHWVRNVEHLSRQREVWVLDLPGFGDSALPHDVRDADELVPCLDALLQHAFPKRRIDVVGFSFGGMTAGLLAAQPAHNLRQLILVGVPGLGLMHEALPMRGMLPAMDAAEQRAVHRHNLNVMMLHQASCVTDEVIDWQVANVARDRMRRRRIARTDVLARAQHRWQLPVHGIWGEQDALYRGQMAQIPDKLPQLQSFTVVPDAGHWVMFEQPQAFHAALAPLLA